MIDPKINEYNGPIVKTMGDGMLVEIASVVDAVNYIVLILLDMTERETDMMTKEYSKRGVNRLEKIPYGY